MVWYEWLGTNISWCNWIFVFLAFQQNQVYASAILPWLLMIPSCRRVWVSRCSDLEWGSVQMFITLQMAISWNLHRSWFPIPTTNNCCIREECEADLRGWTSTRNRGDCIPFPCPRFCQKIHPINESKEYARESTIVIFPVLFSWIFHKNMFLCTDQLPTDDWVGCWLVWHTSEDACWFY